MNTEVKPLKDEVAKLSKDLEAAQIKLKHLNEEVKQLNETLQQLESDLHINRTELKELQMNAEIKEK